jgi:hypothetical protein
MDCLSEAQLASLRESPPGAAPAELAGHVAGCERCQSRLLFGVVRRPSPAGGAPPLPSLGRALGLLALILLSLVAFVWTVGRLAGR